MSIFYNKKKKKIETYSYQINSGWNGTIRENILESGEIVITFKNDKFCTATFPFSGEYTRTGWKLLVEIERKITEIEKEKAGE